MRQIVLDTETTGLDPEQGHRIIEIGCVELQNRRLTGNNYHIYINPEREIDVGAAEVHGITNEMLADKSRFSDLCEDFLSYLAGAELIIHNAPFDVGFLNAELGRAGAAPRLDERCSVLDTLSMARRAYPGQRNSLDALCKRHEVDNTQRELHGALLDAQLLARVYLAMTGGQTAMALGDGGADAAGIDLKGLAQRLEAVGRRPAVVRASQAELSAHAERMEAIARACGATPVWERDGALHE